MPKQKRVAREQPSHGRSKPGIPAAAAAARAGGPEAPRETEHGRAPRAARRDRARGPGPYQPRQSPLQCPASGNEFQSETDNQSKSGGTTKREAAGTN